MVDCFPHLAALVSCVGLLIFLKVDKDGVLAFLRLVQHVVYAPLVATLRAVVHFEGIAIEALSSQAMRYVWLLCDLVGKEGRLRF